MRARGGITPVDRHMPGSGHETGYTVRVIGTVRSTLKRLEDCPRQGEEDAPEAWLELDLACADGLAGIRTGSEVLLFTWLHLADRGVLQVHPRGDPQQPLRGVFATRSPDRPNPVGLHRVTVLKVVKPARLHVAPLEVVDGTPVIDIKMVRHPHER